MAAMKYAAAPNVPSARRSRSRTRYPFRSNSLSEQVRRTAVIHLVAGPPMCAFVPGAHPVVASLPAPLRLTPAPEPPRPSGAFS